MFSWFWEKFLQNMETMPVQGHWRSLFVALALVAGACSSGKDSPTSPTDPGHSNTVHYTVLGASDGLGVGGSIVCAPFDRGCENGTGYAQTIRRRFQSDGRSVTFENLSVPGYVLSRAIADLAASLGRPDPGNFIDRYSPFVAPATTHVTIFSGGNDANVIGSAVSAGAGGGDPRGYIDGQVRQWGNDLVDFVSRVRTRAPNARIVAYNLPNLGAAPYMAGRIVQERSLMQRIATGLSDQVNGLAARGVIVVDLMCDPRAIQPSTFSADGFHPSDAGYALMADLGYAALSSGAGPAPQSACATRTILPVF
jgi:lysophospholipase L1-like esterase